MALSWWVSLGWSATERLGVGFAVGEVGVVKEKVVESDFEWAVVGLCPAMRGSDRRTPAKNRFNWNVGEWIKVM